ncbi:MAG: hypothetical protein PHT12_03965 [Patescibacteria group bacterium]|nr:hypothetical protein [Patescibacteria group bacterium]
MADENTPATPDSRGQSPSGDSPRTKPVDLESLALAQQRTVPWARAVLFIIAGVALVAVLALLVISRLSENSGATDPTQVSFGAYDEQASTNPDLPPGFPAAVPIMTGLTLSDAQSSRTDGIDRYLIVWQGIAGRTAVADFYIRSLTDLDWFVDSTVKESATVINFSYPGPQQYEPGTVTVADLGTGTRVTVELNISR